MILTPALPAAAIELERPVTVRLIGMLDSVLLERFAAACASLLVPGKKTLIVFVRDLVAVRDESLDRFLATLEAFSAAGHRVCIDATPAWRRVVRGLATRFEPSTPLDGRAARRQLIICHSLEKRSGTV